MTVSRPPAVHGTALVIGDIGVLIRGPSGAGKSALALALIADAARTGRFAALIADDRVHLSVAGGRLLARPPAPIAGLIERYGRGIEPIEALPAGVIGLVVDLVRAGDFDRMPEPEGLKAVILAVELDRQAAPAGRIGEAVGLVTAALAALDAKRRGARMPSPE